jgi:hypothetical protein
LRPLGDVFQQHDAPPPAIAGTSQTAIGPRDVGIGGDHVAGLRVSISDRIILPLAAEIEFEATAGLDNVVRADAALDEILGQVHHFAEAVIHHRKAGHRREHARARAACCSAR